MMFDLLYVCEDHPLAIQMAHLYHFYYQLPVQLRFPCLIDAAASGGMNGFLWLCERNGCRTTITSPVKGLKDIEHNRALNATYLNPPPHPHIPEPPRGVRMPEKILKSYDIKPFPVLWHEENGSRRQQGRERPQVPGAISGSFLGEAAHRLLKNTLQVKSNGGPGWMGVKHAADMPPRNRSSGYSAYKGGFARAPNNGSGAYDHRAMLHQSRSAPVFHDAQSHRANNSYQNRPAYPKNQQYLQEKMENMSFGEGMGAHPRVANAESWMPPGKEPYHIGNTGHPPWPPANWIDQRMLGNSGVYKKHGTGPQGGFQKEVRKIYQPKTKQNGTSPHQY